MKIWLGKPKFSLTQVHDPGTYGTNGYKESHFYMNSDYNYNTLINKEEQGITQINWTKISSNPATGVFLHAAQNYTDGWANGPNNIWTMDVKVQATNPCGTTEQTFLLTPPAPPVDEPCVTYTIAQTVSESDDYIVLRIEPEEPCLSIMQLKAEIYKTESYSYQNKINNNQYQITVTNSYGAAVISKTGDGFSLESLPLGVYYVNITKDNQTLINQTLIKN
jgi:hypothetical protein